MTNRPTSTTPARPTAGSGGEGDVLLDTPDQIILFRWLQVKYALKIQARTGLRHSRGSVVNLANDMLGLKGKARHRTAQKAFEAVDVKVAELEKAILEDPA